jgi:hypothetical protein
MLGAPCQGISLISLKATALAKENLPVITPQQFSPITLLRAAAGEGPSYAGLDEDGPRLRGGRDGGNGHVARVQVHVGLTSGDTVY